MQPRSPILQIGVNISLLLSIVATCTSLQARLSSASVSFMTYGDSENTTDSVVMMAVSDILLIVCYNIFVCSLLTTSWLIFYREKWQFYTMKEQWQSIIARELASTNWWVANNQVLGNKAMVCKVLSTYHLLSSTSSVVGIMCYHLALLPRIVGGAMASIPLALSTAVYVVINVQTVRMKVVADNWFVHWEREQIGKLLVAFMLLYTTQQCVVAAFADIDDVLCSLIFAPFFVVTTYGIHHVSTYGIFAKNSSEEENVKRRDLVAPLVSSTQNAKRLESGTTPPKSTSNHTSDGWQGRSTVSMASIPKKKKISGSVFY